MDTTLYKAKERTIDSNSTDHMLSDVQCCAGAEILEDAQNYGFYMNLRTAQAQEVFAQRLWVACAVECPSTLVHKQKTLRTVGAVSKTATKRKMGPKKKYLRTPFDAKSRKRLVCLYTTCPFPTSCLIATLASDMAVSQKKIREWFSNKRKRSRCTLYDEAVLDA